MSEGSYCLKCSGPVGPGKCSHSIGTCVNEHNLNPNPFVDAIGVNPMSTIKEQLGSAVQSLTDAGLSGAMAEMVVMTVTEVALVVENTYDCKVDTGHLLRGVVKSVVTKAPLICLAFKEETR